MSRSRGGEGVPSCVTVCDRGEGGKVDMCDVTFSNILPKQNISDMY